MFTQKMLSVLCCVLTFIAGPGGGVWAAGLNRTIADPERIPGLPGFRFPEVRVDPQTGEASFRLYDDVVELTYVFTLQGGGQAQVNEVNGAGQIVRQYAAEVAGTADPETGQAHLVMRLKEMDQAETPIQTFAITVGYDQRATHGDYTVVDLRDPAVGYGGRIDALTGSVSADGSQPSALHALGTLKDEGATERGVEIVVQFTAPHLAAGAGGLLLIVAIILGAWESLDNDFDCGSWWSRFWNGCE